MNPEQGLAVFIVFVVALVVLFALCAWFVFLTNRVMTKMVQEDRAARDKVIEETKSWIDRRSEQAGAGPCFEEPKPLQSESYNMHGELERHGFTGSEPEPDDPGPPRAPDAEDLYRPADEREVLARIEAELDRRNARSERPS